MERSPVERGSGSPEGWNEGERLLSVNKLRFI
jgi:hypothetical protein